MPETSTVIAPFNNPLIRLVTAPAYRWLRHTIFIIVGLILAYKGDMAVTDDPRSPELLRAIVIGDTLTFLFIIGIIYFMILVLVPRLLFRSKVLLFALAFFVIVVGIYLFVWFIDHTYIKPLDTRQVNQHLDLSFLHFIQVGAVVSVMLASVVGLVVFQKWVHDIKRMNELQQANLQTELEQLKSQVNPHFLFNTLNNLHVLMQTDTQKASKVLLGLSDLLRYQLYDSAHERIILAKDINFIRNLLELEKIRKNDFSYEIQVEGNPDKVKLPPFLFIPFVENAIKHGSSTVGRSYLKLYFHIDENNLTFTAENSKPVVKTSQPGGLGLRNINRRLALLYPSTHEINVKDEASTYTVNLNIPI